MGTLHVQCDKSIICEFKMIAEHSPAKGLRQVSAVVKAPSLAVRFGTLRKSLETIGFSRLLSEAFENELFAKVSRPLFSFYR
jgi:hypothetical protein